MSERTLKVNENLSQSPKGMPLVLEYDLESDRPRKRQRLSPNMARTWEAEHGSPPSEAGNDGRADEKSQADANSRNWKQREEIKTSDREELIQCIKRGERPTWVPKPNLEALCAETDAEAKLRPINSSKPFSTRSINLSDEALPNLHSTDPIPRPPSALHAGDFYASSQPFKRNASGEQHSRRFETSPDEFLPSSLPPWTLDPEYALPFTNEPAHPRSGVHLDRQQRVRAPSLGSSLSSSFVMRTPTSPLVHATSSPASEPIEEIPQRQLYSIPDMSARRRTLPSQTLLQMSPLISAPSTPSPATRREGSAPHQTHQIRRSLTSFTYQPAPSSQLVFPSRQRRLSQVSDFSSHHRSSMIGSFEESILRGRMSTPPSKPLDFVAQIGVLGKGDCPESLKCPAHVSVPFPAVFYNYPSSNASRTLSDDNPSPYVGTIDLETQLKPVMETKRGKRRATSDDPDALIAQITAPENTSIGKALAAREQSQARTNTSTLGGAYRVPQQGQLQVIIKNPNKTAVKLFLIPYDLEGMQPSTKTFVRQRSFSSGPVLEKPISTNPERLVHDPLSDKQILRYLIHLRFCCLGKGKFYLYDSIRVVFANRVPEGKEKLRNEVQLPEPRYSTLVPGASPSRKRGASDVFNTLSVSPPRDLASAPERTRAHVPPVGAPIPFHLPRPSLQQPHEHDEHGNDLHAANNARPTNAKASTGTSVKAERPQSPEVHGFEKISTSQRASPVPWTSFEPSTSRTTSPTPTTTGDGLLSRKLRELSQQNLKRPGQDGR